jgi:DNA repair protein RadA/Sms
MSSKRSFVCQSCGCSSPKWLGQCEGCKAWNSFVEESPSVFSKKSSSLAIPVLLNEVSSSQSLDLRLLSACCEFDRVCGGGMVPGSVLLLGGDPGIGKSTLLLQIASQLSFSHACLYVSGEEGTHQIYNRANRLNLHNAPLSLLTSTSLQEVLETLHKNPKIRFVVIDSIQTLQDENLESTAGSVTQIRSCTHHLIQHAKKTECIIILVGHITKEGVLAGPKVLEHMVDTVFYFEGDQHYDHRILRTVKNRFGPTREIGLFTMQETGLQEVTNPSELFLSHAQSDVSGTAIFAGMEGTRPIFSEIQALASQSSFGSPRRTTVGWDPNRLSMILAVLETRCGVSFSNRDVYLNVVGGLRISEPAADMAVAVALMSALRDQSLPQKSVFFGEVGLSGEIRCVSDATPRIQEALKLGFEKIFCPFPLSKDSAKGDNEIRIRSLTNLNFHLFSPQPLKESSISSTGECYPIKS